MEKQMTDKYRVAGNQITYMKLTNLSISENETLSMLNRYRLCKENKQSISEELSQNAEKEYREKEKTDCPVTYGNLSKYSSLELLAQLFNQGFYFIIRKKLLQKMIFIIAIFCLVLVVLSVDKSKNFWELVINAISIAFLVFIDIIIPAIMEQLKTDNEDRYKRKNGFMKLEVCVVSISLVVIILYNGFNFIKALDVLPVEKINTVEAAELYGNKPDVVEKKEEQTVITDDEDTVLKLNYSDSFINTVEETYKSIENEYFCDLSYGNEDVVAQDVSGKEYTISQLSNQKLLIPYMDGEKAVLFYGQYNHFNWDGECIFNIYEYNEKIGKNVLKIILEAEYDKGNLVSYKKIEQTMTRQGVDVWSISDRIRENDCNYGDTCYYYQLNDYQQDFDLDMAGAGNIIYVDKFESILKETSKLEGYYYGNTSDGYYNDNTGDAYMVKYAEDGSVRTLYKGGFRNGLPDDQTGDAWQLVFDSSNNVNKYFYYEGNFINGSRAGRVTSENYVSKKEIEKIIDGMIFDCALQWYPDIE